MNTPVATAARRWWVLAVVSLIQLMVAVDATIMNIALPTAQTELVFSSGSRQWLVTAYALSFGSLMLLGGRLSDIWGRRNALGIGLLGFADASLLGGQAHNFNQLVTARALQGAFAALLAPSSLAALATTFQTSPLRARAFAFYGGIAGSGAALGLLLGGALTQWWTWRWCLNFNAVLCAAALVVVWRSVAHDRGDHTTNLDLGGAITASTGLFLVVYGFANAVNSGWSNQGTWLSLVVGVAVITVFMQIERRHRMPLLPITLLRHRTRVGSLIALFVTWAGLFALSLILAYYLENVRHLSPVRTGLWFLPLVVALIVSTTMASVRLLGKVGPRPLVPVGMILVMMGMILFTRITPSVSYLTGILPGLTLTGLGLGLIVAPATASATDHLATGDAGAASAMVNTAQQLGGSVGTALINTIAVSASRRFWHHFPAVDTGSQNYRLGIVHGDAVAFRWAAGFFAFGAILTFFLLETGGPSEPSTN